MIPDVTLDLVLSVIEIHVGQNTFMCFFRSKNRNEVQD